MSYIVSITSQGQISIPAKIRHKLGLNKYKKALVSEQDGQVIIRPKKDFWSLEGILHSKVKLTDKQLRKARDQFSTKWADFG